MSKANLQKSINEIVKQMVDSVIKDTMAGVVGQPELQHKLSLNLDFYRNEDGEICARPKAVYKSSEKVNGQLPTHFVIDAKQMKISEVA